MGERALPDNMFMWANSDYSDKLMLLARGRALQEGEATNEQLDVDAIVDDEEPVALCKGRKKKKWRHVGEADSSDSSGTIEKEVKKQRLARIDKTNEWWDALKEDEESKKKRGGRKT